MKPMAGKGGAVAPSSGIRAPVFPIETARLLIRPFERTDVEDAHRLFRHPELWAFTEYPPPRSRVETSRRLALYLATQRQHGLSLWALWDKESERLVGDCGLIPMRWQGPEIEVGYRITPGVWGYGLATEAARAVVEVGLRDVGLDSVVGRVLPRNAASRRVLEKIGMEYEGIASSAGTGWAMYRICAPHGS